MKNQSPGRAALVGFAIIVSAWVAYYHPVSKDSFHVAPFDPSEIERIVKQLRDLERQTSAELGSHYCAVAFDAIPAKVSLNRAFNVSVAVSLPDKVDRCTSKIVLLGTAFSIEPTAMKEVSLDQHAPTRTVIFNLLPSKPGKQLLVYGYDETSKQTETTVYEYPFISPDFSLWFPILGTLFGGTLTIPWWLKLLGIPKPKDEQDKKEKTKKKKKKTESS
jgi:hypothetical protein